MSTDDTRKMNQLSMTCASGVRLTSAVGARRTTRGPWTAQGKGSSRENRQINAARVDHGRGKATELNIHATLSLDHDSRTSENSLYFCNSGVRLYTWHSSDIDTFDLFEIITSVIDVVFVGMKTADNCMDAVCACCNVVFYADNNLCDAAACEIRYFIVGGTVDLAEELRQSETTPLELFIRMKASSL
jgi:hypothetical protein